MDKKLSPEAAAVIYAPPAAEPFDAATLAAMNPAHAMQVVAEAMGLQVDREEIERWAKYADDPPA